MRPRSEHRAERALLARSGTPAACARGGTITATATIQFTSPGRITCSDPRLSRGASARLRTGGDGCEPRCWMRPHVHARALGEGRGAHVIKKMNGPDRTPPAGGRQTTHGETAEIAGPSLNDAFDLLIAPMPNPARAATCPARKTTSTGILARRQPVEILAQLRADRASAALA